MWEEFWESAKHIRFLINQLGGIFRCVISKGKKAIHFKGEAITSSSVLFVTQYLQLQLHMQRNIVEYKDAYENAYKLPTHLTINYAAIT